MKMRPLPSAVLFGAVTLLASVLIVQTVYSLLIRPHADAILAEQAQSMKENPGGTVLHLRSLYIILHEPEPEVVIILTLWAFSLVGYHAIIVRRNRRLLEQDFVPISEGRVILPEDVRAYARGLESLPKYVQDMLLPRAELVALDRFGATESVHDAAEAVRDECEFESSRFDASLSMIRFVAWAIPAVGFVGTVRGIGEALQEAQRAITGDISGVTMGLGVTFNSTLTALTLCIVVMFLLHQLQQAQDQLVLDTKLRVDRTLVRRMRSQQPSTSSRRAALAEHVSAV